MKVMDEFYRQNCRSCVIGDWPRSCVAVADLVPFFSDRFCTLHAYLNYLSMYSQDWAAHHSFSSYIPSLNIYSAPGPDSPGFAV